MSFGSLTSYSSHRDILKLCAVFSSPVLLLSAVAVTGFFHLADELDQLGLGLSSLWLVGGTYFLLILIATYAVWKYVGLRIKLLEKDKDHRQNAILLEGFFEKNPSIMWVKNIEGGYNLVNQSFRDFTGVKDIPVDCIDHQEIFKRANAAMMADQDRQVVKFRQPMEFEGVWPDGNNLKSYSILRFPLINDSGEVFAIGGIANDRTDQVNARKALRDSEKQFRSLVESAADAILIADTNGTILLVNKEAERIFRYSRGQLMRKKLTGLLPDLDMQAYMTTLCDGEDVAGVDRPVEQKLVSMMALDIEENRIPVEVAISTAESNSGNTLTCIVRDVSDRVKLEAQLRESQKMDAIGKLTGGMAHDFNNLLGVMMGNIDLAVRKLGKDNPEVRRLEIAKKAGERGAELTKRMLAVARRQPLKPEPTSISTVLEEMEAILPRTLGPDIEMKYDIKKKLPNVLVDRSGLENVILNLAINSSHAMPNGGKFYITSEVMHLTKENPIVKLDNMSPGKYVQMSVTDTGSGMTKETLSRAFEPFFTTKERGKGTGLGLAMIYGFAKQSGGSVRIYSEPDIGTTIDLFLPVAEELSEEKSRLPILDSLEIVKRSAAEKVLIVDDEYDLLEVTSSYVEELGFQVLAASDGNLALRTLERHPDIEYLLTDIVMPGGMNGVALAAEVRKRLPHIRVLYMSGFPSGVIADKSGIELDAPLITKPFSFEELVSAMDELVCEPA